MRRLLNALKTHRWPILVILFAILIRFYHLPEVSYFTYDNGRDAQEIQKIVEGDLTLIGPTSGLQGFFIGPLWFYAGVPGSLLFDGSPYGLMGWYVFLACLALPLYWWLSNLLFPRDKSWAWLTFLMLAFLPGSVRNSVFVLSPMLAFPLMAGSLLALYKARASRWWLFIGFLLLGLVLHAEFAYGIFFIPVIYLAIFWIREKFNFLDYIIGGLGLFITLLPQLAFEVRNQFLMSKFLFQGLTTTSDTKETYSYFLSKRIPDLFWGTNSLFLGSHRGTMVVGLILLLCIGIAGKYVWRNKQFIRSKAKSFRWQLLSIFALTPYLGFIFWRGNHGHFFSYYLAPHFIFLVPLAVLGMKELPQKLGKISNWLTQERVKLLQVFLVITLFYTSWLDYYSAQVKVDNKAGLQTIETATATVLNWWQYDLDFTESKGYVFPSSVATFTPNYQTAQYDYVMRWKARELGMSVPFTEVLPAQEVVYVILEPDREIPEKRFAPWYDKVRENRIRVRRYHVGILTVETWMDKGFASVNGYFEQPIPIGEQMGWN